MTLSNDLLTVTIAPHGAELQTIENKRTHHQYLWHGDPAFWGRRSPVLFPIVGAVWGGVFRMDGREYPMGQHGFARDMEFTPMESADPDEAWFALDSSEATLGRYPRKFRLEIGYRLQEARITVMWRVKNLDTREMHFQIGAHPAFNYPDFSEADPVHGYFHTDGRDLTVEIISEKGCIGPETARVEPDNDGLIPITADTFAKDALIFGDAQLHRVSLLSKERKPYLTLLFQSPAVGLWSPKPNAPFVCIEPWWGRADRTGFDGDFGCREYVNSLAPGKEFQASYTIIIDNL